MSSDRLASPSLFKAAGKQKYVVPYHSETPSKSLPSTLYFVTYCVYCLPTSEKASSTGGKDLSLLSDSPLWPVTEPSTTCKLNLFVEFIK